MASWVEHAIYPVYINLMGDVPLSETVRKLFNMTVRIVLC